MGSYRTRTNSFNNVELPAVICDILDAQNMSVMSELIINRSNSFLGSSLFHFHSWSVALFRTWNFHLKRQQHCEV